MSIYDKMHGGEIYNPGDIELLKVQNECLEKLYDFNETRPSEYEKRMVMLKDMFAEIGDNVVIGAGSIVTKDLPSDVIAVGNPCKILRNVNEHDKEYYYKERKIDYNHL